MNESTGILLAAREAWARGETPVLATVLATRGSSYRKPGARMLVTAEGWKAGSISGGCLEADVVRRAAFLVESGTPVVRTYDTSVDGDVALGCGGEVDVLLEPFRADGDMARALADVVERRVRRELRVGVPQGPAFQQVLTPAPRLVVCGAGHDALPVNAMAQQLGWDVHVVDWRSGHAQAHRFPGAAVQVVAPGDLAARLPLEAGCAVLVMSHHLLYDARVLEVVLASPLPKYVGALGPTKRTQDLFATLPKDLPRERLRAPVGLKLGGEGPAAVALAVLAEVHAAFFDAPATPFSQGVRW